MEREVFVAVAVTEDKDEVVDGRDVPLPFMLVRFFRLLAVAIFSFAVLPFFLLTVLSLFALLFLLVVCCCCVRIGIG